MLNLSLEDYKLYVDDLMEGLKKAVKFLHSQRIFDTNNLPYQTQLIPLAAILACLKDQFEQPQIKQKISQWYWCGVLGELYGSANETRYAADIQNFMRWLDSEDQPVTVRDAIFTPIRLLSLQTRNSAAYKGVIGLMLRDNCRDFLSGETINDVNYFDDGIDIHHIFPADFCKKANIPYVKCNSIVNKAPLSARTNRILGGKAPSKYLERLLNNGKIEPAVLDDHLRSQLINPEDLRTDNFNAFFVERAKALLDLIEKAMGKKVNGRDSEETCKAFGAYLL